MKCLRQNPFLHNVIEGGKDTLPHVALQRGIEVGNDLEGKRSRKQRAQSDLEEESERRKRKKGKTGLEVSHKSHIPLDIQSNDA